MSSWRPGGVADWADLSQDLGKLWINPTWQKGVYVDNESGKGMEFNGSVSSVLQVCLLFSIFKEILYCFP